jgi:hypothetical protein
MTNMRRIKKPQIKLGKIRKTKDKGFRVVTDSRLVIDQYSNRSQRVVVKVKQSYNKGDGLWKSHGRYLERDTARCGDGFSAEEDKIDIAKTLHSWQQSGDEKLHKIILSPESADQLDMRYYAKEVMAKVQDDLGRELEWVAITHTNTDNSHVHIALRGVDQKGKRLDIESYLGANFRNRSQELATNNLGPRLHTEILEKREHELYAKRVTDIDRLLLWKAKEGIVTLSFASKPNWRKEKSRSQELIRLTFLTQLGLAQKISETRWRISDDLRESLKRLSLCEQLVNDQVPGWQHVKTLERIGVVRKQLKHGDKLVGKVLALNIRDPFGDQEHMLLDATDGKTYHLNQPKNLSASRIKDGDVVVLERRSIEVRDDNTKESVTREFTAVRILKNWETSYEIKSEAVEILQRKRSTSVEFPKSSFATPWHAETLERVVELSNPDYKLYPNNWQDELPKIHFKQIDPNSLEWNPRSLSDTDLKQIVGEVVATSNEKFLVKDVRDAKSRVIDLKDVGLSWPPSIGDTVRVSVKTIPKLRIVKTDYRLAQLLSSGKSFEQHELDESERKFIIARANSWVKWKLLEQDSEGAYRVAGDSKILSRDPLLSLMEQTLSSVRATINNNIKNQPAWMKRFDQESISADTEKFTTLDKLLHTLGESCATTDSWLAGALNSRKELWQSRGVKINSDFEKAAKQWLTERLSPTVLSSGESITGKVVNLSINDERYFAVDSNDGAIRYFRISDRIREQIETSMLEVGDVVTLTGKSFVKSKSGEVKQTINYLELVRYFDWESSAELLKEAIHGESKIIQAVESDSFANTWKSAVEKRRIELKNQMGLELKETRLVIGQQLIGKLISLDINDQTKLLLEGVDGRLHLITQGRAIRREIRDAKVKCGDVLLLVGKEFVVESKRISYTEAKQLTGWSTSLRIDKFALSAELDIAKSDQKLFRSNFARQWLAEAQKRRKFLSSRDITLDDIVKLSAEHDQHPPQVEREFFEIKIGHPVSGKVTEINFGANGAKPRYLILNTPDQPILYIKASQGLCRAVVDGRIQTGDQVTLSVREFSKNGQQLHYTQIDHRDIRERSLASNEILVCKLLSRTIHKESFILVDSTEGKIHLRVSRSIKNQIKSGELRLGDVVLFTAREVVRKDLSDAKRTELKATTLCNWKRSEYLDKAAIRTIRSETSSDELQLPENSFSLHWQRAVSERAHKLKDKGIGLSEDWEAGLKKIREEERQELLRRAPKLNDIQNHDLRDLPRLEVLFNEAANTGVIVRSEANALNFIAAAVKAQTARGNATRIFEEIISKNDWKKINQLDEDKARNLLVNYRARYENAFATSTSEDSTKRDREKYFEREDSGRSL